MSREINEMQQHYVEEDEIDLLDLLRKLWKHKKEILWSMIAGVCVFFILGKLYQKNQNYHRSIVALHFNEIDKGLNPDGTTFTVKRILGNKSLEEAYQLYVKESKSKLSFTDFENCFNVQGIVPQNVSTMIEKKLKNGEQYSFTPKEYMVDLKLPQHRSLEPQILDFAIDQSVAEYIKEYRPSMRVAKVQSDAFFSSGYTYEESINILDSRLKAIRNEIQSYSAKQRKFQSSALNYSYEDILLSLALTSDITLGEMKSKLLIHPVSSNLDREKSILEKKLQDLESRQVILQYKSESIRDAIQNYKHANKEIILGNGLEANFKDNDHYANLVDRYIETDVAIATNKEELRILKKRYAELKSASKEEGEAIQNRLKTAILYINQDIDRLNALNQKYYDSEYSNMISIISPVEKVRTGKSILLFIIAGAFLALFASSTFFLGKEIYLEKKEEKKN